MFDREVAFQKGGPDLTSVLMKRVSRFDEITDILLKCLKTGSGTVDPLGPPWPNPGSSSSESGQTAKTVKNQ